MARLKTEKEKRGSILLKGEKARNIIKQIKKENPTYVINLRDSIFPDWDKIKNSKQTIGGIGELLVFFYEIDKLLENDLVELIPKIEHSSILIGDYIGYDLKSFDEKGKEIFIEVKSTEGSLGTPFYFTRNEINKMEELGDKYYLYRVYNLNIDTQSSLIQVFPGFDSINDNFEFATETVKATFKKQTP